MVSNSQKSRRILTIFGVTSVMVFGVIANLFAVTTPASAGSDVNTVFKKIMLQGLQTCYNKNNGFMVRSVSELDYTQSGISALITSAGAKDGTIKLPNLIGNTLSDADISCTQLFNGYSGFGGSVSGLFKLFGKNQSSTTLANLGYNSKITGETSSDERGCVSFTYNYRGGDGTGDVRTDGKSNTICFNIDGNGKVNSDAGGSYTDDYNYDNGPIYMQYRDGYIYLYSSQYPYAEMNTVTVSYGSRTWSEFAQEFRDKVTSLANISWVDGGGNTINPGYSIKNISIDTDGGDAYVEYGPSLVAATEALRYFTGKSDNTFYAEKLNDGDKYILYSNYLNQALKAHKGTLYLDSTCYTSKDSALAAAGSPGTERYIVLSGDKWCPIRGVDTVYEGFNVLDANGYSLKSGSFKDVINGLMSLSKEGIEESGTTIGTITDGTVSGVDGSNQGGNTTTPGDTTAELAACYRGSGVLGWIACPVTELLGNATTTIYHNFIEPALQIRSDTIMNRDTGVYTSWSTFRNFANILFAIAFAAIIFAQVTGFGVSNYNIKKILPRLIMVAILVNISFILCQLAVDLSNLLGVGLKDAFDNLSITYTNDGQVLRADQIDIVGGMLGGLGLTAIAVGGVVTAISLPVVGASLMSLILPILLALLGALISVIFFFIVLGVRQAGIIILVAIAPVAVVCYALPNTKSFFDRWKKMLMALLMVYPICGLLMGGGQYASALLLSVGTSSGGEMQWFYAITAMLVKVVPFFLVPSLLRGSLSLMGNLGAKVSAFGNGLRGGITRGVRGSRAYQEHQAEEQRRVNLRRDQRIANRLNRRAEGGGIVAGARRRLAGVIPGVREGLTDREMLRRARAQSGITRSVNESSAALIDAMNNDGTINDFARMETMFYESANAYMNNQNDTEALGRMTALANILDSTELGQEAYSKVLNHLQHNTAGMTDVQRANANSALRRLVNTTMAHNGGNIKRESPLLMQQMKNIMAAQADTDLSSGINQIGDNYINNGNLKRSVGGLSAELMPGYNETDLTEYIKAIKNNTLQRGSQEYSELMSSVREALTNPHIKNRIKPKVGHLLQKLANMDYLADSQRGVSASDAVDNLMGAGDGELARIQEGLRNSTIRDSDRTAILNNLEQAMLRGAASSDPASVGMTSSRASQIHKILRENDVDMVARAQSGAYSGAAGATGSMSPDQFAQKYESMMGFKVDHAPRQTLADRHSTWQRATAAHIQSASTGGATPAFQEGDWIDTSTMSKLSKPDSIEAELLERRDVAAKVRQDDENYRQSQNNNP